MTVAQREQIVLEHALFGADDGAVVNGDGHRDQDHDDGDHHHQLDEGEPRRDRLAYHSEYAVPSGAFSWVLV
jgi:hypothetical protein